MSTLSLIQTGILQVPDLMLIYGPDGVGKSTFGSKAPKPVFIGPEKGTARLSVSRFPSPKTLREVFQFLNDLTVERHDYQTLIFDSVDWLEPLIWDQVCMEEGVANIEQVGGGFGKGYIVAMRYWQQFKNALNRLQETKQMNVILIGHCEVKAFTDPTTNSAYDRYQLKLDKRASALLREWVDFVGFANFKTFTKGKETAAKHKAYGDGTRKIFTERRPSFDAKNRLGLPLEMEFEYEEYRRYADADPLGKAGQLIENIEELLKSTSDEAFKEIVRATVARANNNATDLMLIQERLRAKIYKQGESHHGSDASTSANR